MKRRVDASLRILLGATLLALAFAFAKGASLPLEGLRASGRLLGNVWIELALGFVLAGLIEVLIPAGAIARWLGQWLYQILRAK